MSLNTQTIHVLMVCLGNICRSPTAHAVLEKFIADRGLSQQIKVDSAGTGDWHIGKPPDPRSREAALKRGYDLSAQRARQVDVDDFQRFHYILAMDNNNLRDLGQRCPADFKHNLQLFLEFGSAEYDSVPDPYYSGPEGFELVLDLVEEANRNLLAHIIKQHGLNADQ
ncbi:MAG: low molecular weight phosphotyrosine protein phosphatase [Gammaproteobacteria bacterium]|nr:low molecular weight phosphotyrosine protein phosphatase [Gammaproteobacteria bacterium]